MQSGRVQSKKILEQYRYHLQRLDLMQAGLETDQLQLQNRRRSRIREASHLEPPSETVGGSREEKVERGKSSRALNRFVESWFAREEGRDGESAGRLGKVAQDLRSEGEYRGDVRLIRELSRSVSNEIGKEGKRTCLSPIP